MMVTYKLKVLEYLAKDNKDVMSSTGVGFPCLTAVMNSNRKISGILDSIVQKLYTDRKGGGYSHLHYMEL